MTKLIVRVVGIRPILRDFSVTIGIKILGWLLKVSVEVFMVCPLSLCGLLIAPRGTLMSYKSPPALTPGPQLQKGI